MAGEVLGLLLTCAPASGRVPRAMGNLRPRMMRFVWLAVPLTLLSVCF